MTSRVGRPKPPHPSSINHFWGVPVPRYTVKVELHSENRTTGWVGPQFTCSHEVMAESAHGAAEFVRTDMERRAETPNSKGGVYIYERLVSVVDGWPMHEREEAFYKRHGNTKALKKLESLAEMRLRDAQGVS